MAAPSDSGPLAEFNNLRQEILGLQQFQQQILTLQLTISGAIFSFAIATHGLTPLLLIIPFGSYMLCSRYVALGLQIGLCAQYIREDLSSRIEGGLNWEQWLARNRSSGRVLTVGWTLPLMLTFVGPAMLALIWAFTSTFLSPNVASPYGLGLLITWFAGSTSVIATGWLLARWDAPKATGEPDGFASTSN